MEVQCVSGRDEVMPPASALAIPPELTAIIAANPASRAGHIVTGPIAIAGAEPGDMLEIRIEKIEPGADWGYNMIRPLAGTLPEDFHETALMHIPVDRARARVPAALGHRAAVGAVLRRDGRGAAAGIRHHRVQGAAYPRRQPGQQGNDGGSHAVSCRSGCRARNFSVGDGHGVQGDGEVCVTALEMCLTGTFTFILHKGGGRAPVLTMPRAETPTHFISMGLNEDLDQAMKQALREMIAFICSPQQSVARAGLPVLLAGGRFPCDADGERGKGRARDAEKGPVVLMSARILLWTDTPADYLDAIATADLSSRVKWRFWRARRRRTRRFARRPRRCWRGVRGLACCRRCRSCAGRRR